MKKVNSKKCIRRKRKAKLNLFNLVAVLVIVGIIAMCFSSVTASEYIEVKRVVVSEQDTLWSIASRISENNNEVSIYKVIKDIQTINNLEDNTIYPGDILLVYVY